MWRLHKTAGQVSARSQAGCGVGLSLQGNRRRSKQVAGPFICVLVWVDVGSGLKQPVSRRNATNHPSAVKTKPLTCCHIADGLTWKPSLAQQEPDSVGQGRCQVQQPAVFCSESKALQNINVWQFCESEKTHIVQPPPHLTPDPSTRVRAVTLKGKKDIVQCF